MKKKIYMLVGFLAFGLGAVGVVLPILPTTPFLLVASFCFLRGSASINEWFVNTKLYEKHLASFIQNRQMPLTQKIAIPLIATLMILIPFILIDNTLMRIVLGSIIVAKWYYFLFKIKTIMPKSKETAR